MEYIFLLYKKKKTVKPQFFLILNEPQQTP